MGRRKVVNAIRKEVALRVQALVAEGHSQEQAQLVMIDRCRLVQTQDQVVEFLNERVN